MSSGMQILSSTFKTDTTFSKLHVEPKIGRKDICEHWVCIATRTQEERFAGVTLNSSK